MKKITSLLMTTLTLTAIGCGTQHPLPVGQFQPTMGAGPQLLKAQNAKGAEKKQNPIVERDVKVSQTDFDRIAEQNRNLIPAQNSLFKGQGQSPNLLNHNSPFDNPFNETLPFETFRDLYDFVRYSYNTTHEDYQHMNEYNANMHFSRSKTAYRHVKRLYKPSNEQLKRFMMVDTLANSLQVEGSSLPYAETHNPPAQENYKLFPTDAVMLMPTFGEIENYNRTSYEVPYRRWNLYKAARYYHANYARFMQLIMQHGPSKRDAWKLVHREISDYADQY